MFLSQKVLKDYQSRLNKTVRFLRSKFGSAPDLAIVFGSGLGNHFLTMKKPKGFLSYSKIPYFGKVSVEGHPGKLHFIGKKKKTHSSAIVFQGRQHFYEGHPPEDIVFPYRAIAMWGVKRILLTNASGSLRKTFRPGDLVWIKDHLNFTGVNPLRGPNLNFLGPRFPAMDQLYKNDLSKKIRQVARKYRIRLPGGVYVGIPGPSYETDAELRAFQRLGGDLIGMSTVLDAIASAHAGMEVAGLAVITNSCFQKVRPPNHQEVLDLAKKVDLKLTRLLVPLLESGF